MTDEEKIKLNEQEDKQFSQQLDKYYNQELKSFETLRVGKTSNALSLCGANDSLDVTINQSTIRKCISLPTDNKKHFHNLEKSIIEQLPKQLRNPILIFQNKEKNSLVAFTDMKDKNNNQIMIAIGLEQAGTHTTVNRITSVYGRENFVNYINKQIEKGNLIAVNEKRADKMLQLVGLQLPKKRTFISYNDSIAYTKDNVKYPESKKEKTEDIKLDENIIGEIASYLDVKDVKTEGKLNFESEINNMPPINDEVQKNEIPKENNLETDKEMSDKEKEIDNTVNDIINAKKYLNLTQINASILDDAENGIVIDLPKENVPDIEQPSENDVMSVLHSLAEENDANALNILGVCYAAGMNVMADEAKAIEYFEKAAELGFSPAQRNLAIALENQDLSDKSKIIDLYIKAAENNDKFAQNNLAVCYMLGDGVEKDIKKAIEYFERAVRDNDDYAMVNLADCYSVGNGVKKNEGKAFDLYLQAAELGNIEALKNVADCYFNGVGTKQDLNSALKYYRLAADNGDMAAQQIYNSLKEKTELRKHQTAAETLPLEQAEKETKEKPTLKDKLKMGEEINKNLEESKTNENKEIGQKAENKEINEITK